MLEVYFRLCTMGRRSTQEIELKKDCLQVQSEGEEEARRWESRGEHEKGGRRLRLDSADAREDSCADDLQYLYSCLWDDVLSEKCFVEPLLELKMK